MNWETYWTLVLQVLIGSVVLAVASAIMLGTWQVMAQSRDRTVASDDDE